MLLCVCKLAQTIVCGLLFWKVNAMQQCLGRPAGAPHLGCAAALLNTCTFAADEAYVS